MWFFFFLKSELVSLVFWTFVCIFFVLQVHAIFGIRTNIGFYWLSSNIHIFFSLRNICIYTCLSAYTFNEYMFSISVKHYYRNSLIFYEMESKKKKKPTVMDVTSNSFSFCFIQEMELKVKEIFLFLWKYSLKGTITTFKKWRERKSFLNKIKCSFL